MPKRIPWDEVEALLLLDAYDLLQKNPEKRKQIINALSITLRRRAKDQGLDTDEVFRNFAGINMRMMEIEKILHPESIGLEKTSALFKSTAMLYKTHRRIFTERVKQYEEYRVRILPELVGFDKYETVVLLDGYLNLNAPGETRAHTARLISAKLRSLAINRGCIIHEAYRSEGGINGRLTKMDHAFNGNFSADMPVPQVFLETIEMYRTHRNEFKQTLKAANALIGVVILPEDEEKKAKEKKKLRDMSPVTKTKYVKNKKERKLKELYPKEYLAVYKALEKLYFTHPDGVTSTDIFLNLKKQYTRKVISEILSEVSWAKEIKQGKYVHVLGDKIMEAQMSTEKAFFKWLRKRLSQHQVESIERHHRMISAMLVRNKAAKKPLFLIDSADELSKIKSRLHGVFANSRVRNDAVQLVNCYIEYIQEHITAAAQQNDATNAVELKEKQAFDASQTGFYNWLSQHELLAGPTCRCYVSGIRSSEAYAKEHGYSDYLLFSEDAHAVTQTVMALLEDKEFLVRHASYRAHLRKYLQYLGADIPVSTKKDHNEPLEKKPRTIVDLKLISAIEETVKAATEGISSSELEDRFSRYSDTERKNAFREADIIPVLDKFYHKENIEDFDFLVDTLYDVICHQFKTDGGYTSAHVLYKEACPRLDDFFFYNGAFESRAEIYDLAAYLFGKAGYKGANFLFYRKQHIWKETPDYPMDYSGLMVKYAREHGNTISRDEAMSYVEMHGSGTPAQTVSLILNRSGKMIFLQYAENQFVLTEAINANASFCEAVRNQIETLLEGEDYVALGDVSDYFYSTLPQLPLGVSWGPLLLESILDRFDLGFKTIDAGGSNDMKTVDAALLRTNSAFRSFSDIVWNEINRDFQLPRSFTSEEFRQYLLAKGFLHGLEKINSVHKTVANDLRFFWTDGNANVTISKA